MPTTHENDSILAKRLIRSQNALHGIALTEGFTVNSKVITGASTEVLIHQIVACSTILTWVRRTLVYVYKNNIPDRAIVNITIVKSKRLKHNRDLMVQRLASRVEDRVVRGSSSTQD